MADNLKNRFKQTLQMNTDKPQNTPKNRIPL